MEKLAVLCCLWAFGFGEREDYSAELDRLFLLLPEDDFLPELEDLGGDSYAAWVRISPLVESSLNADEFGKELLAALEKIYNENRLSPLEFGERRLHMLYNLPRKISDNEPFHSLFFADIPYDKYYYDEKQTREIYQNAFDYYKEKP